MNFVISRSFATADLPLRVDQRGTTRYDRLLARHFTGSFRIWHYAQEQAWDQS
jgi:hypothetical protein